MRKRALSMERLLMRVRAEFLEMPGMHLTITQAARLLGLKHTQCADLFSALVRAGFLRATPEGKYCRAS